eukprot:CAMPEP_0184868024 /NCGR_PEP_ID=MMETSP0580-20130426/28793_1 /TAXON_ID=1118495 /ORGANISM="Dactyliosolen fragilissimus" /LENGTH=1009 /DNA_ID=CAMNT_0027368633 /DNA_START=119 /DNA_END=3148 /DNA_ORIENTATION=-
MESLQRKNLELGDRKGIIHQSALFTLDSHDNATNSPSSSISSQSKSPIRSNLVSTILASQSDTGSVQVLTQSNNDNSERNKTINQKIYNNAPLKSNFPHRLTDQAENINGDDVSETKDKTKIMSGASIGSSNARHNSQTKEFPDSNDSVSGSLKLERENLKSLASNCSKEESSAHPSASIKDVGNSETECMTLPISESKDNNHADNMKSSDLESLILSLKRDLALKDTEMFKVKESLEKNNSALASYRDVVRKKNSSIRELENEVSELKLLREAHLFQRQPQTNVDVDEQRSKTKKVSRRQLLRSQSDHLKSSMMSMSKDEFEKVAAELKEKEKNIAELNSRVVDAEALASNYKTNMERQKFIVRTLTDENNTYRSKEVEFMQNEKKWKLNLQEQSIELETLRGKYADLMELSKNNSISEKKENQESSHLEIDNGIKTSKNDLSSSKLNEESDSIGEEEEDDEKNGEYETRSMDRRMQEEIDLKQRINEALVKDIQSLKEENQEHSERTATLGGEVMRLERKLSEQENQNTILEKLLEKAREATTIAYSSSHSYPQDEEEAPVIKNLEPNLCTDEHKNEVSSGQNIEDSYKRLHTLHQDLSASMKREESLREQLSCRVSALKNVHHQSSDEIDSSKSSSQPNLLMVSILEQLTESQQETISFLSKEIDDLKDSLDNLRQEKQMVEKDVLTKQSEIRALQVENELFASEIVSTDKEISSLKSNLSLKGGENACLRDEVNELQEKIKKLTEESLGIGMSEREEQLEKDLQECMTIVSTLEAELIETKKHLKQMSKKVERADKVNRSESKKEKSSSEENSSVIDLKILEDTEIEDTKNAENDKNKDTSGIIYDDDKMRGRKREREFTVLKMALKQKYESTIAELETELTKKDDEITQLQISLSSSLKSAIEQKEEMEQIVVARISDEAEATQRQQHLVDALAEKEQIILALKSKRSIKNQKYAEEQHRDSWGSVSSTVSAGMEAFTILSYAAAGAGDTKMETEKNINDLKTC